MNNSSGKKAPFFIVGAGRSGTTLLRLMLCGHPGLFIPPEAWFLGDVMWRLKPAGPLSAGELEECERLILGHERWKDWNCPDTRLREVLQACEGAELASVIDRIFREVFELPHEVRWGEKSPKHSYLVERIGQIFPDAQFIHLIRDGRDVAASLMRRGWFSGSARRVAEHWRGCLQGARKAAAFGAGRYLEIRFEDLVTSPENEIRCICSFLGVGFDPGMLAHREQVGKFVPPREAVLHAKLAGDLDAGEVGKWKKFLSPWQEAVFWTSAREVMAQFYPHEKPSVPARWLRAPARVWSFLDHSFALLRSKIPASTIARRNDARWQRPKDPASAK